MTNLDIEWIVQEDGSLRAFYTNRHNRSCYMSIVANQKNGRWDVEEICNGEVHDKFDGATLQEAMMEAEDEAANYRYWIPVIRDKEQENRSSAVVDDYTLEEQIELGEAAIDILLSGSRHAR